MIGWPGDPGAAAAAPYLQAKRPGTDLLVESGGYAHDALKCMTALLIPISPMSEDIERVSSPNLALTAS